MAAGGCSKRESMMQVVVRGSMGLSYIWKVVISGIIKDLKHVDICGLSLTKGIVETIVNGKQQLDVHQHRGA